MNQAKYRRRLSIKLTLFAILALLSSFLIGGVGTALGLLTIGYALVELFFPVVVVSGGFMSVLNSAATTGYDVYPLSEISGATIWSKYASLDLTAGRTVSIWLTQFTGKSRAAFVRDLSAFLETRSWPLVSHAA